jgi:hypothetical protein
MFETDVLAMEIAVTIPYVSVPPSFGEFTFVASYECPGVRHKQSKHLLVNGQCGKGLDLFEILFRGSAYGFDAPEFPAFVRYDVLMELGQRSAHVFQRAIEGPAFANQLEEETVKRNTLHSYSVLCRQTAPLRSKAEPKVTFVYGLNTKVNAFCETRIEYDLLLAKEVSFLQRGEIEKTVIYRFLNLVNEIVPDKHVGYVCL